MRRPPTYWFRKRRECLEFGERGISPIRGTQDNGNDAGLLSLVPGYGLFQLDIPAKGGGHEMGADEEQDNLGCSQVFKDLLLPFGSGDEIAIKPVTNHLLVSQIAQVDCQFIAEFAIFVCIGDKNTEWHALLPMEWNSVAMIIISRDAPFVTKGSMNVSKCRKALSTISTPGAFSIVCSDDRISDYSKLFF